MATGADNWADATPIGLLETSDPTPNASLTQESGEVSFTFRSAWWAFTATDSGWIRFRTTASTIDPSYGNFALLTGIYTGTDLASLTNLAFDYGNVRFQVTAGETYWVQVSVTEADIPATYVLEVSGFAVVGEWISSPVTDRAIQLTTFDANVSSDFYDYASSSDGVPPGSVPDEDLWAQAWAASNIVEGFVSTSLESVALPTPDDDREARGWAVRWLTMRHGTPAAVTSGTYPFATDDPDRASIEWEPTSTTVRKYLTGSVQFRLGFGTTPSPVYMKAAVEDGSTGAGPVMPGILSAGQVATLPTVGRIDNFPDFAGSTPATRSFTGGDLDLPNTGPSTLAVAAVSHYTIDQVPPTRTSGSQSEYNVQLLRLFGVFRPRYRELRWDVVAPPTAPPPVSARVTPSLRMLQRGGSGGMSGIPRMVGDPTRRGIRQGPGSVY